MAICPDLACHIYDLFDALIRSFIQLPSEMFPQILIECVTTSALLKSINEL
jgi:hypothetical protein